MGSPINNDSAKKWHQRGIHVRQKVPAKNVIERDVNQGRSAPTQLLRAEQVSREQECERECEALQRNHRSKFGDDDAAREAAGSAAMLRAKELLKSGSPWRKAAKLMPRKLIGVRERVHTFGSARKRAG